MPQNDTTHCGHGRRYSEPCPECEAIWREDCIASLRKQAAALGFVLVPVKEAARDGE